MKPTVDIFEVMDLPEDVRSKFLEVWEEPIIDFFDRNYVCERCGAIIDQYKVDAHIFYHKNLSLMLFLQGQYVVDHDKAHKAIGDAFPDLVALLLAAEEK